MSFLAIPLLAVAPGLLEQAYLTEQQCITLNIKC